MQQSQHAEHLVSRGFYPLEGQAADGATFTLSPYVRQHAEKHFAEMAATPEVFPCFIMHLGSPEDFTAVLDEHGGRWIHPNECVDLSEAEITNILHYYESLSDTN